MRSNDGGLHLMFGKYTISYNQHRSTSALSQENFGKWFWAMASDESLNVNFQRTNTLFLPMK